MHTTELDKGILKNPFWKILVIYFGVGLTLMHATELIGPAFEIPHKSVKAIIMLATVSIIIATIMTWALKSKSNKIEIQNSDGTKELVEKYAINMPRIIVCMLVCLSFGYACMLFYNRYYHETSLNKLHGIYSGTSNITTLEKEITTQMKLLDISPNSHGDIVEITNAEIALFDSGKIFLEGKSLTGTINLNENEITLHGSLKRFNNEWCMTKFTFHINKDFDELSNENSLELLVNKGNTSGYGNLAFVLGKLKKLNKGYIPNRTDTTTARKSPKDTGSSKQHSGFNKPDNSGFGIKLKKIVNTNVIIEPPPIEKDDSDDLHPSRGNMIEKSILNQHNSKKNN